MLELIPILIGVIMGIIVIANVVIGVLSGFKKSLACLLAVVLSGIITAVATLVLFSPATGFMPWVVGYVVDWLSSLSAELAEVLAIEEFLNILTGYLSMIIAPFFFMILFIILGLIFTIILTLISKKIPVLAEPPKAVKKKRKKSKEVVEKTVSEDDGKKKYCDKRLHRLGGLGVGIVTGFLVAVLSTFGLVGIADMACDAMTSVVVPIIKIMDIDTSEIESILPAQGDAENAPDTMKVYDYTGSTYLYDVFASTEIDGDKVVLREDVGAILSIASGLIDIAEQGNKINENHVDILENAVKDLDRSPSLKYALTATLSALVESEKLDVDGMLGSNDMFAPVIEKIIEVAASADKDNITADLTTLVNVADILVEYEVINESDYKKMLEKFGEGAITELLVEVNKNERMRPVADEINLLSVRALASAIGVPKTPEERYELLMNETAYILKTSYGIEDEERVEQIMPELQRVFGKYGVNIEGVALRHVAEGLVADLGHLEVVDGPDVTEFFALYAVAAAEEESAESAKGGSKLENLSASSSIVVNDDGTISVNGVVLKNYSANSYRDSAAYRFGHDHVDIGLANTLDSAEHMKSTLITVEEVISHIGHYGDCGDNESIKAESEKVGEIFAAMINIISNNDVADLEPSSFIGEVGHVLDLMKGSQVFGNDTAKDILTMVLQSDTMTDALGLSIPDVTEFANKINDYAEDKATGYEEATTAISNTVSAITKATDKEASASEKIQATADMIHSLNKENAEMVGSLVTGDMVGNFGASFDNSNEVSDSLKSLINNMADYKSENPDDASVNKEAEAVTKILSLAVAGSSDGAMFDKRDENGELIEKGIVGPDADSFIASMVESDVVMGTVNETCEGKVVGDNPYGITYDSEEEKEDVAAALESYYFENGGNDPELKDKIVSLSVVMDVEIDLNNN